MNYKYLVLDFGKVVAGPITGNWDITPKFKELIDVDKLDMEEFKNLRNQYKDILSEKVLTLEEEYDMFYRFYDNILSRLNIPSYEAEISKKIAYDRTYNLDKYELYEDMKDELENLSKKYTLIMLTDNWPCVNYYLKHHNLYDYFDKIYVSSICGCEKKDKVFFDYLINDYNIKENEALFIDDVEENLDIGKEKGLDVVLMDRYNIIFKSKYKIINDLSSLY